MIDADVADAAASVGRSLETAARGLIYEQAPQSLPAQALAAALHRAYDEVTAQLEGPRSPLERDAARALAALAEAARRVGPLAGDERQGFLELARRVLKPGPKSAESTVPPSPPSSLIIP